MLLHNAAQGVCRMKHCCGCLRPGLAWISKRLSSASALLLCSKHWQGLVDALGQNMNRLPNLQELQLLDVYLWTEDKEMAFFTSILWLLASAPKLRLLHTCIGKVPWFPPLVQLKHLVLRLTGGMDDTGKLVAGIRHAGLLETLCLENLGNVEDAQILQLEKMHCLRAVGLKCVRPAAIHLPEDCSLHIPQLQHDDLTVAHWDSAFQNIRTADFENDDLDLVERIPAFFTKLQNVRVVRIDVGVLGTPKKYLSLEDLAHVHTLYLCGNAMYLKVPARVSWHQAWFHSCGEMGSSFEEITWFSEMVPLFDLRFENMVGPSLLHLTSAWTVRKIPWSAELDKNDTVVRRSPELPRINPSKCFCTVCLAFLKASGIACAF